MKKYLYIALAAAALTSCSSDEVMETVEKQAIAFGNPFIENSTRAVDPSYGEDAVELTQFNVWGTVQGTNNSTATEVSIFKNDAVTGKVGTAVWSCDKTQYWIAGAPYKFAAVVNGGVDANFTLTNHLPTAVEFTSTDGQTDLMYDDATATGATAGNTNDPVNFEFNHMLAKAVFTVTNNTNKGNTNNSNYYYKVSNIKILNPMTTGTCTFATKAWTETSQATGTYYEFGNVTNAKKQSKDALTTAAIEIRDRAEKVTSHRECMLIPYDYTTTKLQISFDVALYMEVDENAANDVLISTETKTPSVAIKFEAGYAYSFNIEVGVGTPIQFTVTTHPSWTEVTPGTTITVE